LVLFSLCTLWCALQPALAQEPEYGGGQQMQLPSGTGQNPLQGSVGQQDQMQGGLQLPLQDNPQTPLQGSVEAQQQQFQSGTKKPMLQGGVEHSYSLPPVDKTLRSGANFDERAFTNVVPTNLWVAIPPWMAGTWETRTETQLEFADLTFPGLGTTNQPRMFTRQDNWIFGMQTDKYGQIWHFINVPSYRKVVLASTIEHRRELSKEFLFVSKNRVMTRYRFLAVIANTETNKIQQVRQQETVMLYKPESQNVLRGFGSVKIFSQEGIPLLVSKNFTPFYRVQHFAPVPTYHGIDMRKSFRDYLVSHNLADRVPDDLKAQFGTADVQPGSAQFGAPQQPQYGISQPGAPQCAAPQYALPEGGAPQYAAPQFVPPTQYSAPHR
jgi:hypothetical protein